MQACCLTDVGRVRDHNEDCYGEDLARGLWVVADGMGGHAAGEVASELAVSNILRLVADGLPLPDAVAEAHHLIRQAPAQGIGTPGMGTTVVVAQLSGTIYRICWVGDSRAYAHGEDGLRRITRDHSYVQHLVDSGAITAAEAETHPERNVVTQCLGAETLASVEVGEVTGELHAGETLLLCSDGLTGEVDDPAIASVLGGDALASEKAQELIDLANANGGGDNITVALIPAPADARPRPIESRTRKMPAVGGGRPRKAARIRLIGWASAAAVAAAALAAWLMLDRTPPSPPMSGGGSEMSAPPPDGDPLLDTEASEGLDALAIDGAAPVDSTPFAEKAGEADETGEADIPPTTAPDVEQEADGEIGAEPLREIQAVYVNSPPDAGDAEAGPSREQAAAKPPTEEPPDEPKHPEMDPGDGKQDT